MHLLARNLRHNPVRYYHRKTAAVLAAEINRDNVSNKYSEALEKFKDKIAFNSLLEVQKVRIKKLDEITSRQIKRRMKEEEDLGVVPISVALSQLCDSRPQRRIIEDEEDAMEVKNEFKVSSLPYSRFLKVEKATGEEAVSQVRTIEYKKKSPPKNWLKDYELYDEAEDDLQSEYGTPDPHYPVTEVPCGGCGALLHCKE